MTPSERNTAPRAAAWAFRLAGLVLLGLGALWAVDRAQRWETPSLDAARFEVLAGREPQVERSREPQVERSQERWLVALNPRCPHCSEALARLRASRSRLSCRPPLVVLIVDTPRRPAPVFVARVAADAVWWDRRGVWRRRWGHRLYGEVLRFDGAGHYLGSVTAASLATGDQAGPRDSAAALASERR